jgi:RNA polymerase sigma factor (sigma-70 family)
LIPIVEDRLLLRLEGPSKEAEPAVPLQDDNFNEILAAARSGAEWAWSELYGSLAGQVTGYLAARGAAEPEDLASEVFLQVARSIVRFEGDLASFRSWVFVITHRRLLDERRKHARRPTEIGLDRVLEPGPGGDVEVEAVGSLVTEEIAELLEALTEPQRNVLALRIIAGLTLAETAQVVGRRVGAVKALQRRAVEALRKQLEDSGSIQSGTLDVYRDVNGA